MEVPGWLKKTLFEMVPELVVEYFGVQSIKKLLNKGREKADKNIPKPTTAKTEGAEDTRAEEPEVKRGGLFNFSDEEAYLKLMGELKKKEATKISSFLAKNLEPWQQRRFRASVGNLGDITIPATTSWTTLKKLEVTEKYPLRKSDAAAAQDSRTEYEQKEVKSGESTEDLGVKFLKSFARCTEPEMLDICIAAGIMHSDFDGIKQGWKKITDWAETQGPTLIQNMDELAAKLTANAKPKEPKKPYRGFFRELFSFTK